MKCGGLQCTKNIMAKARANKVGRPAKVNEVRVLRIRAHTGANEQCSISTLNKGAAK